jgi:hypothetical protein
MEKERPEDVDHTHSRAICRGDHDESTSWCRTRGVRGPDDAIGRLEVRADLGSPERMVPECDRVGAHPEELIRESRRDADPVRGVLAVDDADVDLVLVTDRPQALLERPPPGGAYDIGDEEDSQGQDSRGCRPDAAAEQPPLGASLARPETPR